MCEPACNHRAALAVCLARRPPRPHTPALPAAGTTLIVPASYTYLSLNLPSLSPSPSSTSSPSPSSFASLSLLPHLHLPLIHTHFSLQSSIFHLLLPVKNVIVSFTCPLFAPSTFGSVHSSFLPTYSPLLGSQFI